MFNFKNIGKLFSYNWSKTIKSLIPKGNKTKMDPSEVKNINNGAIVRIIGVVVNKVAIIGIAVYVVVKAYSWLYGSTILSYAISEAVKENLVKWIIEIFVAAIIPIGILVYNNIMKKREQNGWPIFVILIISLVQTLYALYGIISFIISLPVSPIFALLGLVSVFFAFLGNVHICVGCIDFLEKQANMYNMSNVSAQNTNTQPVQNMNMAQPSVQPQPFVAPNPVNPYEQPNLNAQQPVQPNNSMYSQPQFTNANQYNNSNVVNNVQPEQPNYNTMVQQGGQPEQPSFNATVQPEQPKPRFCPNCGSSTMDGSQFCHSCGTRL